MPKHYSAYTIIFQNFPIKPTIFETISYGRHGAKLSTLAATVARVKILDISRKGLEPVAV